MTTLARLAPSDAIAARTLLQALLQLWESNAQALGMKGPTTMKRHRHTPEEVVRKLRKGERRAGR